MNKNFPYGYQPNQDGLPVLDTNKAPYVKVIFDKYLDEGCQMDIMKWLIEVGATPPRVNSKWGHSSIGHILTNSKYCGEDNFPQIITKEIFLAAQKKRYKHNRYLSSYYNNTPYTRRKKYDFTGKVICSQCNKTLTSNMLGNKNATKKQVWQCGNYITNGKVNCKIMIENNKLEQHFVDILKELHEKFELLVKKVERIERPKTNNEIIGLDLQIKGKLEEINPNREVILELLNKRTSAMWSIAVVDDFEHRTFKLRELLNSLSETPEYFDGDIFNSTIKQVTLYPTGKVAFIFLNGLTIERTI